TGNIPRCPTFSSVSMQTHGENAMEGTQMREHNADGMQFGIFSVSDVTENPTTGTTVSEGQRIKDWITMAVHAEEVGLDVVAIGEHHNPPFFSSPPSTTLANVAARTKRILLSAATALSTTNDPVKIAEDFAMLQHVA